MRQATEHLIQSFRASRVQFTWMGTRKSLTTEQKGDMADTFDAAAGFLSGGKKLIDTKHPKFKAVTKIKGEARDFWQGISLPYPDPGVRLIRENDVTALDLMMGSYREKLHDAVSGLEEVYQHLQAKAREDLGRLYNPADYPATLVGLFDVSWSFPNVDPPDYLRELNPRVYEEERQRVVTRFDEAVRLAEDAFASELSKLVGTLVEKLNGDEDGKPKSFSDSAVGNLAEFFDRFRMLFAGVHDSTALAQAVEQAQAAVRGISPEDLRSGADLRRQVATTLSAVGSRLEGLLIDRPRRRVQRHSAETQG